MGYFEEALSNFVQDFNYGGAIRHLTDLGYSAKAIREKLKCPFDTVRIQEIQYRHLLDKEVLISEEKLLEKGGIYAADLGNMLERAEVGKDCVGLRLISKEYTVERASDILEKMFREHEGKMYLDFPFGRMGEVKQERVMNAATESEKAQIRKIPWHPERTFIRADSAWIRMSVRLNHLDVIYSTYFFLDPAVTVMANADKEYLFFTLQENVVK